MKSLKRMALAALSRVVGCTAATEGDSVQLTQHPEALAAYQRGQRAGMQGQHAEALRQCETAVRHDPSFAEGHRRAGVALLSLGRAEEAIAHYKEAIRLAPRLVTASFEVASLQSGAASAVFAAPGQQQWQSRVCTKTCAEPRHADDGCQRPGRGARPQSKVAERYQGQRSGPVLTPPKSAGLSPLTGMRKA